MRILLIDNHDSFTYNLFQMIARLCGVEPTVVSNDYSRWREVSLSDFDAVVISPGPGRPEHSIDVGFSAEVLRKADLPILGVCLGHQLICYSYGAEINYAPNGVMHGRLSNIFHDGEGLFAGLPIPFEAARYHSLVAENLPPELESIAVTPDKVIMGVQHTEKPIWGVQFHPESVSTEYGDQLILNFCDLAAQWLKAEGREIRTTQLQLAGGSNTTAVPSAGNAIKWRAIHEWSEPAAVFQSMFADSTPSFWLDSALVAEGSSRFSFMGEATSANAETLSYNTATSTIERTRNGVAEQINESIFSYLDRELAARRVAPTGLPFDFALGYIGYLGYELKHECGGQLVHRSEQPDAFLLYAERGIAFDHQTSTIYALTLDGPHAESWLDATVAELGWLSEHPAPTRQRPKDSSMMSIELRHTRQQYLNLVAECHEQIHEGESYEVCLTNMITAPPLFDVLATYLDLRSLNPAPFAAFMQFPALSILSSSPERFLRIDTSGHVEAKPIKGTSKRGETASEDWQLIDALQSSEKDRSENRMIVDLLRNDLGIVCEVGSVHVPKIFDVETYATVHQLVSTVSGQLRSDRSAVACVKAAFPGGSMTGAPKVRTMEIIDRLEGGPRGVYSGAIGYFSLSGSADWSIVIRSMVSTPEKTTIGVGGAITALSDPEQEFEETMLKAQALIGALGSGQ